jgi:hypothetical protein
MSRHHKVCNRRKIHINKISVDNKIDDQYSESPQTPITQLKHNLCFITGLQKHLRSFEESQEAIIHEFFNESNYFYLNTRCPAQYKHHCSLETVKH